MTRRIRRRFAWLGLFALLLQQSALARHLCDLAMPAAQAFEQTDAPMTAPHGCHDHGDVAPAASDGGCRQHCDANQTRVDPPTALSVPMLLAQTPDWFDYFIHKPNGHAVQQCAQARGDPPPRQRFCSLLI